MKCNILLILFVISSSSLANRAKRFLIVPPTAPTRHQWIVGIGIPLDLENIAVTTGYVLKAQYYLPTKAEELRPSYAWPDLVDGKRKKREASDGELRTDDMGFNYTRYSVPAVVVVEERLNKTIEHDIDPTFFEDGQHEEEQTDNSLAQNVWMEMQNEEPTNKLDDSRWNAYKMIAGVAERYDWLSFRYCIFIH